jgi:dCMP deaminase
MMDVALVMAKRSTCGRRQVGAVATDSHGRVVATAHNGVPMGMDHCAKEVRTAVFVGKNGENIPFREGPCKGFYQHSGKGLDLCEAIHGEQNLLSFCSDTMKLDTVYVTCSPCVHCVKMLLNTSARRVVFQERYAHDAYSGELWKKAGRSWEELGPEADTPVPA